MPILPSSLTSGGRWRCNCKMTHAGCFYSPETNRVLAQLSRSGSFWGLTRGVLPNFQPLGPQFMGDFKPAKTERDDGTVGFRASSTIYSCKCIFLKLWICKHWGLLFKLHLESRGHASQCSKTTETTQWDGEEAGLHGRTGVSWLQDFCFLLGINHPPQGGWEPLESQQSEALH
ncbi:uncharacterized protein LOC125086411 isoform X3 [Lutra lutra]|uniref:uncharacterized protein LOC125086411 isoform X3 n=1 Tax=Lutra lutra TaxID=9657 RepID=UPI001FD015DB|nr:uncharacterized protein LOC125086411 isoform X3 [Lutra lutra]